MKHKCTEFIFVIIFVFVLVFNMIGISIDGLGNSLKNLPEGKLQKTYINSNNSVLNLYTAELKGVGTAVRGEVVLNDGTTKNIYWAIGETSAEGAWINETTVKINGNNVSLDGEPFDSRRRIELPDASYKNIKQISEELK